MNDLAVVYTKIGLIIHQSQWILSLESHLSFCMSTFTYKTSLTSLYSLRSGKYFLFSSQFKLCRKQTLNLHFTRRNKMQHLHDSINFSSNNRLKQADRHVIIISCLHRHRTVHWTEGPQLVFSSTENSSFYSWRSWLLSLSNYKFSKRLLARSRIVFLTTALFLM